MRKPTKAQAESIESLNDVPEGCILRHFEVSAEKGSKDFLVRRVVTRADEKGSELLYRVLPSGAVLGT